jgi:hypothetical protein
MGATRPTYWCGYSPTNLDGAGVRIIDTRMEGTEAQVIYRNNEGKEWHLTLFQPPGGLNGPKLLVVVRQWLGVQPG